MTDEAQKRAKNRQRVIEMAKGYIPVKPEWREQLPTEGVPTLSYANRRNYVPPRERMLNRLMRQRNELISAEPDAEATHLIRMLDREIRSLRSVDGIC